MHKNLRSEMTRKGITLVDISEFLGLRYGTVVDKVNGKYRFYYKEALAIKRRFFPDHDIEYLFDSDSEDDQTA